MAVDRPTSSLRSLIRDVRDFPRRGVTFRDITPLLGNPPAMRRSLDWFATQARDAGADVVVGVESRGFVFGAPVADRLGVPFVPIRKAGKLPAARMSAEYTLEYGSSQLDIHVDAFEPGVRAVIVDDLLATGGTAAAAATLVELIGGSVALCAFLIELVDLGGRGKLEPHPVASLLDF